MGHEEEIRHLKEAPEIKREIRFYPLQMIGISLMMLIPALAVLGIFGETKDAIDLVGPHLSLRMQYPTTMRYKMIDHLRMELYNTSPNVLTSLTVTLDRKYIDSFSEVQFTPQAEEITSEGYEIIIPHIPAGETRVIDVQMQAKDYGSQRGSVKIEAGQDSQEVKVRTFVFP